MASKAKIALVNAFLKLVEEESFEKITVTKLVERCSISRQTFYYHFDDLDAMLIWAFKNETETICKSKKELTWKESAANYITFLNRYDNLLRNASKSDKFIFVYNLLFDSFYSYINTYFEEKGKKISNNSDYDFFVTCIASSFAGLVTKEIQKEKSDYEELLSKIVRGFKLLPSEK